MNIPGIFNDSVIAEAADMNTNHLNTIIYICLSTFFLSTTHTCSVALPSYYTGLI